MKRVSAPERTREALRALIDGRLGSPASRSELVHLALRLIVEEALEGEVTDAIGRERCEVADQRVRLIVPLGLRPPFVHRLVRC